LSQEANIQGDPYLYPGTSVLRNLADIRDTNHLNQFESDHFFARLLELHESPIHGSFDSDHLRHVHEHLSRMYTPGPENSARFRSPRVTPSSLGQSTSERNCRSYFISSPASNICEGSILRDSANAPLTTLARSMLCIHFARETDERSANSFESWLWKLAMRLRGISLRRTKCSRPRWQVSTEELARRFRQS
jgi:hypothetical protein